MSGQGFEIVESRVPQGLGFLMRSRASGALFRISPMRDPDQPRFWCLRIDRCLRSGIVDPAAPSCVAEGQLTRDALIRVLAELRMGIDAWLDREECRALRQWLDRQAALAGTVAREPAHPDLPKRQLVPLATERAEPGSADVAPLISPSAQAETPST